MVYNSIDKESVTPTDRQVWSLYVLYAVIGESDVLWLNIILYDVLKCVWSDLYTSSGTLAERSMPNFES